MEYIDLRKVGREGLKEIRRQVVRLKKLSKTEREVEELTGVRQNRASEIWTAYQREGESSLERKKAGRKPGTHMVLTQEKQAYVRKAVEEKRPAKRARNRILRASEDERGGISRNCKTCGSRKGDCVLGGRDWRKQL